MQPALSNDFRAAAADASETTAREKLPVAGLESESLCLRFPGDPTLTLYRIAVVPWVLIVTGGLLFLFGLVLAILILTPWVDATFRSVATALGSIVLGIALAAYATFSESTFDGALARRLASRKPEIESRFAARYRFAIEDPATYKKQKVISEDYAFGGLDRVQSGLLLDGLRYRYVIRPRDVTEVVEDKGYLLITYSVRGSPVTLAITLLQGEPEEEARVLRAIRDTLTRR